MPASPALCGEDMEYAGVDLPVIMVSPSKYELPADGIPSSFSVITEEDIVSTGKVSVKEVLRTVPGLNVVQSGSFGAPTSIFTRGTESSHTLFMIDGVKVFDPTSTNGAFNLANITLDNIERLEVLRGPHSTLYGSDAMGGVINVITKKGRGTPRIWASFEGGSYDTLKEAVGSYGEIKGFSYSAAFTRLNTDGISKADEKYNNEEEDSYENMSFSAKVEYEPYESIRIGSTIRRTEAEIEIDDAGGYNGDDPNRRNTENLTAVSAYLELAMSEWWDASLRWFRMHNERFDKDFSDDVDTNEYLYAKYEGLNTSYELHNTFKLKKFGTLSVGVDYDRQQSDPYLFSVAWWGNTIADTPKRKNHDTGYYIQHRYEIPGTFYAVLGARLDDHSEFSTNDTYKVHAKYIFDWGASIKGGWSTGFKAPSLYQLYDPSNGNSALEPEESETYELGIGQTLFDDKLEAECTYFYSELDNLIDWVLVDPLWFTGQYRNINRAEIWGLENTLFYELADTVDCSYSYTYMETENEATEESLDRRPRHKHALNLTYRPLESLDLNLSYVYSGNRKDRRWVGGTQSQIILGDYHKLDLSARYRVCDNMEVFSRIENMLDEHYQEVDGYGTAGLSVYAGLKAMF